MIKIDVYVVICIMGVVWLFGSHSHAISSFESKWVQIIPSVNVDTDPPSWSQKLNTIDLRAWLTILPHLDDRKKDEYLIIPWLWIIAPVVYTSPSDPRYKDIVDWRDLDVNRFLKQWVHHYPGTSLPWLNGNALIWGHSNFFKDQKTDFTSIFATLPMLDRGDEIIYYKRMTSDSWMQYKYSVIWSYETTSDDASAFDPLGTWSEMTLYTCVPIGTSEKRWIIRTKLEHSQRIYYPSMTQIPSQYSGDQILDDETKNRLIALVWSWVHDDAWVSLSGTIEDQDIAWSWSVADSVVLLPQQVWWKQLRQWIVSIFV